MSKQQGSLPVRPGSPNLLTNMNEFKNLNELAEYARQINKDNGFGEEPPPKHYKVVQLALIGTEVSEAIMAYQKNRPDSDLTEELADVIIRAIDMAAFWGWDIDAAVKAKLEKNKNRGYRHGNKAV